VALDPNDAKTRNYLGISSSRKGLQEAAEQECRKAIELDDSYGDAHFNLAVIYATQTPPAKELAKRHYNRALELGVPKDEELEKLIN
jgi:Tfp pilus assembly protein PilF